VSVSAIAAFLRYLGLRYLLDTVISTVKIPQWDGIE